VRFGKAAVQDYRGYEMANRSMDWLRQAEEELRWAEDAFESKSWALVCFTAQQVAEKSLKAIAMARGAAQERGHSAKEIATALEIDGELETMARILDQYYISTRYPDAFVSGSPFEYFVERQASEAIEYARAFTRRARTEIPDDAG
jgi:HEPN domain-containing protein